MNSILIALSYAFCWGVGTTLTKLALAEISATTLLVIQLVSSVLFLAIACYITTHRLPFSWSDLKQGVAGVFEPALAYMVGIFGVNLTTASNAVLIGSSEVILTILMAAIFLGERLTRSKLLLAFISFLGVALLVWNNEKGAIDSSLIGNLLVLIGTVFAVCYVMMSKKQIETANPLQLTASQQFVGLIVTVFCFGILSIINPTYEVNAIDVSLPFWLLAIGSGIMQYAIAYLLYLTALQKVPASQAAFYIALIPIFGVASAVLLLGEQPSLAQYIGGAFVIVSSYWANRLQPA
ncbi:MAG: DMT family transporter [Leptolyngbyaceae cyanobacterium SM1_3_5]|nr:DMT family transporter [Leptolyngbyaceae cyanobacterium SM1_3_5]